jgi:arginyl-tRNA synthetase
MIELKARLRTAVFERLKDAYPLSPGDVDFIYPPQPRMGDLALPFPFQLAKKIKANPRQVAQDVLTRLGALPGVTAMEVAGAGYINFFLDKPAFFKQRLGVLGRTALRPEERKIVVEHTNINPNKAAHIGHLRNACLGDTLVRCLRAKGETVEVQNYIDDTGVQVVDVVFGFQELEVKSIEDLETIDKFDYYCWDLYARTVEFLAARPEYQARKADILKKIEHAQNPEFAMATYISRRILRAHLATMQRIGAAYDVLPCESSILGLKFWEKAFALLRSSGGIHYVTDGPNAKCWVMRLEDEDDKEKIIVRSDGTVTYVGKDIAYQCWKFGLLGKDFFYEPFLEDGDRIVWISTAVPNSRGLSFGRAGKVYNVIDTRQSYLQKVVVQGLRALGFGAQADKSVHFSYEMVALSPRSLKDLGLEIAPEDGKSFVEVSGRKGLGVKADDLLDRLTSKARAEVDKRQPDFSDARKKRIAADIACGALRYFMLKYARNSLIIFDFDEALSFEGETGPYLQYTCVRIASIFRKLEEREGLSAEALEREPGGIEPSFVEVPPDELADAWDLITTAAKFEEEILHSIESLEFSHLAKYTFILCQKFNGYYHKYPVLNESNPALKAVRLRTVLVVRSTLIRGLDLMGIPVPERM